MPTLTTTAQAVIDEARMRADAQTTTPTVDFTTDAELLIILTKATREFIDLVASCDDAAIEVLAVPALLSPPYTLPNDFYRLIDVEVPDRGDATRWLSLRQFNWRERNDFQDEARPRYRVMSLALTFRPESARPDPVRIFYVPYGPALLTTDSLPSLNGWDDFMVATVALYILAKEDRDPQMMLALRQSAIERIREACRNFVVANTLTVARVEYQYEEAYDLI